MQKICVFSKNIFALYLVATEKAQKGQLFLENNLSPQLVALENAKIMRVFENVYKLFTKRKKDRHHFTFKHSEKNHAQNRSFYLSLVT